MGISAFYGRGPTFGDFERTLYCTAFLLFSDHLHKEGSRVLSLFPKEQALYPYKIVNYYALLSRLANNLHLIIFDADHAIEIIKEQKIKSKITNNQSL